MCPEAWRVTLEISPRSRTWPKASSSVRFSAKASSVTEKAGALPGGVSVVSPISVSDIMGLP